MNITFADLETLLPTLTASATPYEFNITDTVASNWSGTNSSTPINSTVQKALRSVISGVYIDLGSTDIPSSVTNMESTFRECTSLTTAPTIPSSVTNMGYTFDSCTSLTTAPTIPSSVTNMYGTFKSCTSLTTAPTIPSSVTNMGYTFDSCTSLTTAPTIPSSVTDMYGTFRGCSSLTEAPTIPSSVTNMSYTFRGCSSLTEAPTIPSSITNINHTFYGCTSLTTAPTIPSSVTSMGYTFQSCTGLKEVSFEHFIPSTITQKTLCFTNCTSLESINVPAGSKSAWLSWLPDTSIPFSGTTLSNIVKETISTLTFTEFQTLAPTLVASATPYQFKITDTIADNWRGTSSLTLIDSTVQKALRSVISGVYIDLSATDIPSSVTNMESTFQGCTSLTTAPTIPSSVTDMSYTFYSCTSLTTAPTIPSSVTNMYGTFQGCTYLTTAPTIPSSVTNMYATFQGCTSLTTAPTIPSSVTNMNHTFRSCSSLTTAPTIPSSVTSMGYTFRECTSLTTAPTIPSSVTNMYGTFQGCTYLTTAPTIPSSVTNMMYAFNNCSSLTTIDNWQVDTSQCTMTKCFKYCTSLANIYTKIETPEPDNVWSLWRFQISSTTTKVSVTPYNGTTTTTLLNNTSDMLLKLYNYTDELLFDSYEAITDNIMNSVLLYKLPFGDGLDPTKQYMVVWAKDPENVVSNCFLKKTDIIENAITATKLATARKINGVDFDGTSDIYDTYSTEEHRIGTWIDGKPIYRKVINFGSLPNTSTKNVAHGISDIDKTIRLYGTATGSEYVLALPWAATAAPYSIPLQLNPKSHIEIQTGIDRTDYTAIVIIEYTKTTD